MSSSQRDCPGWRISDAGVPRASKIAMFDEEFRKMMQCAEYFKDVHNVHVKLLLCVISSFRRYYARFQASTAN